MDAVLIISIVVFAVGLLALLTVIGSRSRERNIDPDDVRVDEIGLEPEEVEERPRQPRFPAAAEREEREGRFSRERPAETDEAEDAHDEHSPPEAPPR